jgi:protein O-mannosyl-transferase
VPIASRFSGHERGLTFGLWLLALLAFWLLYRPGLPGDFVFDDYPNLQGLTSIASGQWDEILSYCLQGKAGPGGRPLSLLTFGLQYENWPADPGAFKRINMLIHAVNASLLLWLLTRLLVLTKTPQRYWIALAAAALWLLWPIQVSTVLYVVQRMTLLAATCMLLGLIAYIQARRMHLQTGHAGLGAHALFVTALGVGVGLGLLSKENAIVFPLLVLIIEVTLLSKLRSPPRAWRLALWVPIGALVAYLTLWFKPWQHYGHRDFDLAERVLTQGRILWLYVTQIVLPSAGSLRFLYDNYPISTGLLSPVSTALAWAGWIVTGCVAWVLRKRRPIAAFSVLFFLGSHVLESTILPLELVFEHRNYLGSSAIALALVAGLFHFDRLGTAARVMLGAAYLGMVAFVTLSLTSLWGDSLVQKRFWYAQHPESARTHMAYATLLLKEGYPDEAARLLDAAVERFPEHGALAIARVEIGCIYPELRPASLNDVLAAAARGRAEILSGVRLLDRIVHAFSENACPSYTADQLVSMLDAAQDNPHFQRRLGDLELLEGIVYSAIGDVDRARVQLNKALHVGGDPKTLIQAASWELANGNKGEARRHLDSLRALMTESPKHYLIHKNDIDLLENRYAEQS